MKKIILGFAALLLTAAMAKAQGLENITVEKYYVSNAADAAAADADLTGAGYTTGTLPAGSVTYRIYADMLPGYNFQATYGVPAHALKVTTSTQFYNSSAGSVSPTWSRTAVRNVTGSTVGLDSYFSVGSAATNAYGILKSEDNVATGGANLMTVVSGSVMQNADASAGLALTTQDGYYYSGAPSGLPAPNAAGVTPGLVLDIFNDGSVVGNSLITNNGSIYIAGGSTGPIPATNRVLIGQFTTDGVFHYELNVQIGGAGGSVANYVASNPVGAEISLPSLSGTLGLANVLPTVSITSPANGANFITGDVVSIAATAADADGSVTQVEFFVDGSSVGIDATAPYDATWTSTAGSHNLTAVATDNSGATKTSTVVVINVANNQAPTVSISAPTNAVTGDLVTLTATAADVDGTIASVDFYVNNVIVGNDATAPYTFVWTAVLGANSVKARATDDRGLQTTSSSATIIVGNNVPPTVSLTAPTSGALYTAPAVVTISANAADIDGTVTGVDFYVNNVLVGSDATSPYSYAWTSVIGTAVITAKATDNRNAVTTSSSVTLDIADPNALPYKVVTTTATCLPSSFCLPVAAVATVSNVIGYDVVLAYNKNKVTPTGNITVASALINPSYVDVINSIDATNGLINISLYFNSSAPASTNFNGVGNVFCVEFTKNGTFTSVDTAAFSITSLQESYFTGVSAKLANSGKFITYKDSSFNASLRFWNGNTPIRYNSANPTQYLITNIYGNDATCSNLSAVATQPDLNGNFTYTTDNGLNVTIQKDILGTTDVQPVINGADALLARRVLVNDISFTPSIYNMVSMDVNLDGVVSAGDVSQINQRAVLMIPEFRQAWNYSLGGVSNGQPSKDWLFIDSTTISTNPAYAISATYPANDGVGFSKSRVPVVAFCLPVPVANYSVCPLISVAAFKGLLVGDVNGNFATVVPSNLFRTSNTEKVIFDLAGAVVANGHIDVPVFVSSTSTVNALDFAMQFNTSNLSFNSVVDHTSYLQALSHYNTNDNTLRFTSNSLQDYVIGQTLVTVRFNGTSINESDLTALTAYLNGEKVATEVLPVATGMANINKNDSQVSIYPNPAADMLNVVVAENASISLLDAEGREVVAPINVTANQKQEINTDNIASGVYMMKIANANFVSMKKVVIKK